MGWFAVNIATDFIDLASKFQHKTNQEMFKSNSPQGVQRNKEICPKFPAFTAMITACLIIFAYRQSEKQLLQSIRVFQHNIHCGWRYKDRDTITYSVINE